MHPTCAEWGQPSLQQNKTCHLAARGGSRSNGESAASAAMVGLRDAAPCLHCLHAAWDALHAVSSLEPAAQQNSPPLPSVRRGGACKRPQAQPRQPPVASGTWRNLAPLTAWALGTAHHGTLLAATAALPRSGARPQNTPKHLHAKISVPSKTDLLFPPKRPPPPRNASPAIDSTSLSRPRPPDRRVASNRAPSFFFYIILASSVPSWRSSKGNPMGVVCVAPLFRPSANLPLPAI